MKAQQYSKWFCPYCKRRTEAIKGTKMIQCPCGTAMWEVNNKGIRIINGAELK